LSFRGYQPSRIRHRHGGQKLNAPRSKLNNIKICKRNVKGWRKASPFNYERTYTPQMLSNLNLLAEKLAFFSEGEEERPQANAIIAIFER